MPVIAPIISRMIMATADDLMFSIMPSSSIFHEVLHTNVERATHTADDANSAICIPPPNASVPYALSTNTSESPRNRSGMSEIHKAGIFTAESLFCVFIILFIKVRCVSNACKDSER